jgi:hypothetical protein
MLHAACWEFDAARCMLHNPPARHASACCICQAGEMLVARCALQAVRCFATCFSCCCTLCTVVCIPHCARCTFHRASCIVHSVECRFGAQFAAWPGTSWFYVACCAGCCTLGSDGADWSCEAWLRVLAACCPRYLWWILHVAHCAQHVASCARHCRVPHASAACALPHARYALHGASATPRTYVALAPQGMPISVPLVRACATCNDRLTTVHPRRSVGTPLPMRIFPEQSRFHRFHGRWHAASRQRNDLRPQHCRARLPLLCEC